MLSVEFPSGAELVFDCPEALARALQHMRAGTPLIVRDEHDGTKQVVWAPSDAD